MTLRSRTAALAAATAAAIPLLLAQGAAASTISVTSTADNKTDDQLCTLREAVDAANDNAPVNPAGGDDCPAGELSATDTIQLDDETYGLTIPGLDQGNDQGDLDVSAPSGPVVVAGEGSDDTTVDGNDHDRVFETLNAGSLTLRDLTVTDGTVSNGRGGLVDASLASLTLDGVTATFGRVEGTIVSELGGGGINGARGLTIIDSVIASNLLDADAAGAGTVSGGGVLAGSGGPALIERSTIDENGIVAAATQVARGGGLGTVGTGNTADLTIRDSTISGNGAGGGDENEGGGVSWVDSTNDDTLLVQNSTFSSNTVGAGQNGGGLHIRGGSPGTNRIAFTTFGPTSPTTQNGAGYYLESGSVQVRASLFATGTDDDCNAGTSLGHNVEQLTPGDDCHFNQPTDVLTSVGVLSGGLFNNGGPTQTEKLEFGGNPAVDHVPAASCLDVAGQPLGADQRGAPRPAEGDTTPPPGCDVGAYELDFCQGIIVNRVGTAGNDTILNGTPGVDAYLGLGGNDVLDGDNGADRICGGDGDDRLLDSDSDDDTLDGGPGADRIDSSLFQADTVDIPAQTAGTPDDTDALISVEGARAGFGNDVLIGDGGPNVFDGGFDDDTITGAGGPDVLDGGGDDDQIFARDGAADTVNCNLGAADTAQTDQPSLDPSSGCETVDALAEPVFPPVTQPKKKCKKGRKLKKVKGKFKCVKKKRKKK